MLETESDSKSHLIKRICDISNSAKSCTHLDTIHSSPFIDWYILYQVEENVSVDIIRKKYHKYALLLHPDKNNHPKAEFAFKLVSEAYACLSDGAKRLEFDDKRRNKMCNECVKMPQTKAKMKVSSQSDRSRSKKISTRLKEVKARFMEEARVIEKCLKANANVDFFTKETPIFEPNDHGNQGYNRSRLWRSNESNISSNWLKKRFVFDNQVKCDSPVFECKPNRSTFKLKSIHVQI